MTTADVAASNCLPDTGRSDNGSGHDSSKEGDLGKGNQEPFQLHHVHDSLSKVRVVICCMIDMAAVYTDISISLFFWGGV